MWVRLFVEDTRTHCPILEILIADILPKAKVFALFDFPSHPCDILARQVCHKEHFNKYTHDPLQGKSELRQYRLSGSSPTYRPLSRRFFWTSRMRWRSCSARSRDSRILRISELRLTIPSTGQHTRAPYHRICH
jgi:hypothetical protein